MLKYYDERCIFFSDQLNISTDVWYVLFIGDRTFTRINSYIHSHQSELNVWMNVWLKLFISDHMHDAVIDYTKVFSSKLNTYIEIY